LSAQSAVPTTAPETTFESLDLPQPVVRALARQEITVPTPVQAAVIPDAMNGHDVLGRAQTGSGKTLAFGLPILARLAGERSRPKHPRALIIVPTRELATQVRRSLEPLAEAMKLKLTTVYGGTPYDRQIKQLRNGADIVVATPGRLEDLISRGSCRTDDIAITVLDEADHLCDLGFYPVVDALMAETPEGSQRLLLSATLDGDVDRLVRKHLRSPKLHELDANQGSVTTMDHHVMVVGGYRDKVAATTSLMTANPRSIVFVRTREGATELAEALTDGGIEAVDLHGNLSQRVRERNLHKFSSGRAQVVVATDVAARGIHVDNVGLVVHYDPPSDAKGYLHRSGRTARAGESGAVITITTPRQLDEIVRMQQRAGVDSRHHDIRTAPQPMTAEALAGSGAPAPAAGRGPRGGQGSRGGQGGRGGSYGGSARGQRSGDRGSFRGNREDRGSFGGNREDRGSYRGNREDRGGSFREDRGSFREDRGGYRGNRDERPARGDRRDFGSDRPNHSDRNDRNDRPSYTDRNDRPVRTERRERPDFRDRGFRPDGADRRENTDRTDRRSTADRTDRPQRSPRRDDRDRPAGPASSRPADRQDSRPTGKKKPRWSQAGR
jgi:superfamily II DNA/RNA helicase